MGVSPLFLLLSLTPLLALPFTRRRRAVVLAALGLMVLSGGVLRFQQSLPAAEENRLRSYNDRGGLEIRGSVAADPEMGGSTLHVRLEAQQVKVNGEWREVAGSALLFLPPYESYAYGDVLLVSGQLRSPPRFEDFDYAGYLAQQGIHSTMLYPEIEVVDRGQGSWLLERVYWLRRRLAQSLAEALPEPAASLAQAVVLGLRGNMPSTTRAALARTGTAHLLAISGLHLSIMAGILLATAGRLLGKRHHLHIWVTLGAIWLYALITGMNPPVVRAAVMATMFLAAEMLGRQRNAITALAFAAAVMVGIDPRLPWVASFQLSFLAMAGLVFISPRLQSRGRAAASAALGEEGTAPAAARYLVDAFSATLGVLIVVWPVIAYHFGIISLVAPVATLLALPALPGIAVVGGLTAAVGLIAPPISQVLGWLAWLFASYMLLVVDALAALPVSAIEARTDAWLLWAYYPVLVAVLWLSRRQAAHRPVARAAGIVERLPKRLALPPLLAAAAISAVAVATMPDARLHVSFLDVGQGDATLIQVGAQDVLVDGGPSPRGISLALGQQMPFWDRTIELVVLTHPHSDHLTGLLEVLRRYRVRQVLHPDLPSDSPLYEQWLRAMEAEGARVTTARAGQRFTLGDGYATVEVLSPLEPPLAGTGSDIDNNGIVLRIEAGRVSFLIMPDTMSAAELELVKRRAELQSTVLKVGHHGSSTSTSPQLLAVVAPRAAVVSVGADNRFGHPSEEVLARLSERVGPEGIYRTDQDGTVEFITDGERLWVSVER